MSIQDRIKGKTFTKVCAFKKCAITFVADTPSQRYCSPECGEAACILRKSSRRSDKKYYRRKKAQVLVRGANRAIARKSMEDVPYVCIVSGCGCTVKLQRHHIDGDTENNMPTNLEYRCPNHHALEHNPPRRNAAMVESAGAISPTPCFCKLIQKLVVCTTLKCPGRRHCVGVATV